jgi:hypothetical protein
MTKALLVVIGLVAVLLVIRLAAPVGTTGPAAQGPAAQGPTVGVITFRDQAGLTLRVQAQLDAMRLLAAGSGNREQILSDNDALKTDCARIEAHQRQAGLNEAGIAELRSVIHWAEFQAADDALRRAPGD